MKVNKKIVFILLTILVVILLITIPLFLKSNKNTNLEIKPEIINVSEATDESKYKEVATKFCIDRLKALSSIAKEGQKVYNNTELEYLSFNFDQDLDKEILALCDIDTVVDRTNGSDYMALIILDKQEKEYKVIYSSDYEVLALEDAYPEGGYFRDLKINDINKDGIDEIVWRSGTSLVFTMVNIYSPKTNQYFNKTKDDKTGKITFSDNLTPELQAFKDYLNNYSIN
ncbi:MAG: hypothetical protein WC319_00925 [Candidatus Paceibacterota bacterium]|jgi:competence protein ComGC